MYTGKHYMKVINRAVSLRDQVEIDEQLYREIAHAENDILVHGRRDGFADAYQRIRLSVDKQALSEMIRRNKIVLAYESRRK